MQTGFHAIKHLGMLIVLLATLACTPEQPIKIGFSGPLEGRYSDLGVQGRNGAQLAIEDINSGGGLSGRRLLLIATDDSGRTHAPHEADRLLVEQGVVAIIGHMTSSATLAALPYLEGTSINLISPTTSTPRLSGKKDHFFRVMSAHTDWAKALARYAKAAQLVNVSIISDSDNAAYAKPFVTAFEDTLARQGGLITNKVEYASSSFENPGRIIHRAALVQSDAVLIVGAARDTASLIHIIRRQAPKLAILIAPWAYTTELVVLGGPAVNGVITSMDYSADSQEPRFTAFQARFFKRFGQEPNFAAAYAYEAVLVLAEALLKTGGQADGLAPALLSIQDLPGLTGTISLDSYGDVQRPFFVLTITDGKMVRVADRF